MKFYFNSFFTFYDRERLKKSCLNGCQLAREEEVWNLKEEKIADGGILESWPEKPVSLL